MQAVSAAYKEQIQNEWRNHSYVRVSYGVFNLIAGQQARFADNGRTVYGNLNINDDVLPDRDYATFEKDYWRVDGKQLLLPAAAPYNYDGFVSSAVSSSDNTFVTDPTITVSFSDPQDIFGLTFTFPAGQVPREIKVNGAAYYPDSENYVMPDKLNAVSQITIDFVKAPAAGRRVRLNRLQLGQTVHFENEQLIKTSFSSSIDFLSLSLTQKQLSVTIDNSQQVYNPLNPSGLYAYLAAKQPVEIDYGYELEDGSIEWMVGDNMVLESTPTTADTQAIFTAVDNLFNLTGMFNKGLYRPNEISLYDLAKEVLDDAGVEHFAIDDHLKTVYTKAALPIATHRECLQIIANAGQCILYTDRAGAIKLEIALDPTIQVGDNGHMAFSSAESAYNDESLPTAKYADFLPNSWKAAGAKILLPGSGPYMRVGFVSDKICGADGTFSRNIFDKSVVTNSGYYVGRDSGELIVNSDFCVSNYISVLPNTTYYISHANLNYCQYDEKKNFISPSNGYGNTSGGDDGYAFTAYANAHYIRVSIPIANLDKVQVEFGAAATSYMPYATDPVLYWTYSFPYSAFQIPITFDNVDGEYATDFDVVYKLVGKEIDRVSVTGNTAVTYTVEHEVSGMDEINIEVHKWSVGTRRAMIAQIGKGRVNDMRIDFNTASAKPVVEKSAQVKTVTVNCYSYTPAAAATELYHQDITPGGTVTLNITHDAATEISASVTGIKDDSGNAAATDAVITAQEHYTYYSVVTLAGTKAATLSISGKVLTTASVGVVKKLNPQGEDKAALENPLITDLTNAQNTAVWIADYFSKRNILTTGYRGNTEIDAHDLVYMESQFEGLFPARIMEHKIEFNGALSGSVKAVKMNG